MIGLSSPGWSVHSPVLPVSAHGPLPQQRHRHDCQNCHWKEGKRKNILLGGLRATGRFEEALFRGWLVSVGFLPPVPRATGSTENRTEVPRQGHWRWCSLAVGAAAPWAMTPGSRQAPCERSNRLMKINRLWRKPKGTFQSTLDFSLFQPLLPAVHLSC